MSRTHRIRSYAAAAVTAMVAALVVAGPAGATPTLPSSLFDPSATSWVSLRDLSSAEFAQRFNQLSSQGMMVIDLEVDVSDGTYRVGAVFQRNTDGRGWASRRDLTSEQFHDVWSEYGEQGLRLVDQETYVAGAQRLYAGVWVENVEDYGWVSYRDVTSAEFSQKFATYRDGGFLPIDVEVYPTGAGWRYAAVWVENAEGLSFALRRGLTSSQYASAFNTYKAQGLRSIDVEPVETASGMRYAGIWIENGSGRKWAAYRDMSATGYRNRWNQLSDLGYRLVGYETYETESGTRYAGIWRQTSDRPDWALRDEVDGLVQADLDTFAVPGYSVAIAHDGELVYLRGFGYQDIDDGIWMHGRSVHRIASVSKAVAGVLAMRMDTEHADLDLSDPARDYLPQLPAHHTYTVAQTVMNRSCVKSYPAGFSEQETDHYDTALDAVEDFMDQQLGCRPGQYLYSTGAYTVFGAILEQLEDKPIADIVVDEITTPFGLATLRPEDLEVPVTDRVTLYATDNQEYDGDDLSWKVLGGGLESSALDLARLGLGILDGTILTTTQREKMWNPIGSYGYGWDVGTADSGERVVGKAGGQPGAKSYLRIYPDDDIVIVVLSNRWKGGHSASALSKQIGELMLDELP